VRADCWFIAGTRGIAKKSLKEGGDERGEILPISRVKNPFSESGKGGPWWYR